MGWLLRRRKATQPAVAGDYEAARRAAPAANTASAASPRADCPHAPHGGPCGKVQPICPACHTLRTQVFVPSIVRRVQRDGAATLQCSGCEKRSFNYDAELVCVTCQWLVPDVNDRLAERFAGNRGPAASDPDVCPGCGNRGATWPVAFPVTCPSCATPSMIPQEAVSTAGGVTAMCSNQACGFPIVIPAAIWCPDCRLNLRTLSKITALVQEANNRDPKARQPFYRGPLEQVADRLAALVDANERRYDELSPPQRKLIFDAAYLDALVAGGGPADEWIRDQVEIRAIGHQLNREGGTQLMRQAAERAATMSKTAGALRILDVSWDRIGDWLG
jgi:hypothetical protein